MTIPLIIIGGIVLLSIWLEVYEHLKLNKKKYELKRPKKYIRSDTKNYCKATNKNYRGNYTSDLPIPKDFKKTMDKINQTDKRINYKILNIRKGQS